MLHNCVDEISEKSEKHVPHATAIIRLVSPATARALREMAKENGS